MKFHVKREGDSVRVVLDAGEGQDGFLNGLDAKVEICDGTGECSVRPLVQVGPGTYHHETTVNPIPLAEYRFRLLLDEGSFLEASTEERGLYWPYPEELRFLPPDEDLLRSISEATGGKYAPEVNEIFDDYGDRVRRPVALWPLLASLALAAYFLDVLLRRAPGLWARLRRSTG